MAELALTEFLFRNFDTVEYTSLTQLDVGIDTTTFAGESDGDLVSQLLTAYMCEVE